MRQEVRDDEGEVIEGKAGRPPECADDGALPRRLSRTACATGCYSPGSLASRASHLRTVSALALKRRASTPVGSVELAHGWAGAGLRMNGEHHVLLRRRARRRRPLKSQIYSSNRPPHAVPTTLRYQTTTWSTTLPTPDFLSGQPRPHLFWKWLPVRAKRWSHYNRRYPLPSSRLDAPLRSTD
jgi:hypothetical protein